MPETVTSTAYLRIAPTAIRNIEAPIVMALMVPARRRAANYDPCPGPSGPRWRKKRWKSLAIVSAEGSWPSSGGFSAWSSSIAVSSRSTKALTSGSLATAAVTWRS